MSAVIYLWAVQTLGAINSVDPVYQQSCWTYFSRKPAGSETSPGSWMLATFFGPFQQMELSEAVI